METFFIKDYHLYLALYMYNSIYTKGYDMRIHSRQSVDQQIGWWTLVQLGGE